MLLFLSADSPEPKGRKVVVMLTLRKLKEMVESPKKGEKKPSCKSLREGKYPVVAQKIIKNEVGVVTITVYKNGYVVYQAQNRVTVFPIEDISGYRYSSVAGNGYGCNLTESYFEEAEWYLRFVLRGEDRLSINLDSCNQKRCISLSSAMEEMQLGESVAPDMEEMIVQQMVTENMITGMWQVSGRSDITDFEEIVRLDTEYISQWNIGLDIKILFKTVLAVLKRDGSC